MKNEELRVEFAGWFEQAAKAVEEPTGSEDDRIQLPADVPPKPDEDLHRGKVPGILVAEQGVVVGYDR